MLKLLFAILLPLGSAFSALSENDLETIGRKVWHNECGGTRDGLTSWNEGEDFASLGIGHFIWYPEGVAPRFEESFPKLLGFFVSNGVKLPGWLEPGAHCPWRTRSEFLRDFHGEKMTALRDLLASTTPLQSRMLALRLEEALPKMLAAAPDAGRENIRSQFARLKASGAGTFALIDYVNFKGEGTNPRERYNGEGWGLLQALSRMHGSGEGAVREFSVAAAAVLELRVHNAPAERHEARWLPGWKSRVQAY